MPPYTYAPMSSATLPPLSTPIIERIKGMFPTQLLSTYIVLTPLSPDVNLDAQDSRGRRKPLESVNGHKLMSIFPARPDVHPELLPGPTSNYFERQERAFFANGNELRSVQRHLEANGGGAVAHEASSRKNFDDKAAKFHWSNPLATVHPRVESPTPLFYPHPGARSALDRPPPPHGPPPGNHRASRSPSVPEYPPHAPRERFSPPPHCRPTHSRRSSLADGPSSTEEHGEDDESWRRPTPYNERRRAGKHTKRMVVRQ